MQTFRCPDCKDIILIVLPGDEVDEAELHTKIQNHENKHEEFNKEFSLD